MPTTISRAHGNERHRHIASPTHGEQPDLDQEYVVVYTQDGTIITRTDSGVSLLESEKEMKLI
ncbi:MAG: hypothetical protein U5K84_14115 [Alkalibacterium sp.]|nr:hypothetical protein [Alkalibacterium sp.]